MSRWIASVFITPVPAVAGPGFLAGCIQAFDQLFPLVLGEFGAIGKQGDRKRIDRSAKLRDDEIGPARIVAAALHGFEEVELSIDAFKRMTIHRLDGEVGAHPRLRNPQSPEFEDGAQYFRIRRIFMADAAPDIAGERHFTQSLLVGDADVDVDEIVIPPERGDDTEPDLGGRQSMQMCRHGNDPVL